VHFRRSAIIAELWRPEIARPGNYVSNFRVFKITTHCGKIFKILSRLTLKCSKIYPTRNQWNRALFILQKKKISAAFYSNCCYCADIAHNLTGPAPTFGLHYSRFHPNRFTFCGVIAERRNASTPFFCPVEYFGRIITDPKY